MTGERVRDIGFLAWENDLAWMEHMRGKKWHTVLRQEKHYWETLIGQRNVQEKAIAFRKLFNDNIQQRLRCGIIDINGIISVIITSGKGIIWQWKWFQKWKSAITLDTDGTHCWYTRKLNKEHYRYEFICEAMDGTIRWIKKDVSTEFAIRNGHIYYIKLQYPFNTTGIYVCDAYTGHGEKLIYSEYDSRRFIDIIKCANNSIFLRSSTWQESKLWKVEGTRIIRVCKDSLFQMPLDSNNYILTEKDTYKTTYQGTQIKQYVLPPKENTIKYMNINTGHVITNNEGEQILWHCQPNKQPTILYTTLGGEFYSLAWPLWHNEIEQKFIISTINSPTWIMRVVGNNVLPASLCHISPFPLPRLTANRFSVKSEDGTRVSYLLIHKEDTTPKNLLCYVYGAYGVHTAIMWPYVSWAPLLTHDWAIAYAYPRGSGDRDTAWMRAGQADKHIKTIEDFEAVIRDSQRRLSIPPERTVIYGRSAGGLIIGGTTARNPDGKLMGATYTEVPFVDGVRSQTNPEIPLVESGFTEYGNPIESIRNFKALLDISPMNSLPADGAPGVFVICRTGLKDLQVLPFEPVKWIQRLRGRAHAPAGKFLSYEEDQAHVYSEDKYFNARSMDLAVLDLWADGKLNLLPARIKNLIS